jgi:hypothetical protein
MRVIKMGDVGEMFGAYRDDRKEKKRSNLEFSTKMLEERGIFFDKKNGGSHLIVVHNQKTYDFWPSTGKYKMRGGQYRRGIRNMLNDMEVE